MFLLKTKKTSLPFKTQYFSVESNSRSYLKCPSTFQKSKPTVSWILRVYPYNVGLRKHDIRKRLNSDSLGHLVTRHTESLIYKFPHHVFNLEFEGCIGVSTCILLNSLTLSLIWGGGGCIAWTVCILLPFQVGDPTVFRIPPLYKFFPMFNQKSSVEGKMDQTFGLCKVDVEDDTLWRAPELCLLSCMLAFSSVDWILVSLFISAPPSMIVLF